MSEYHSTVTYRSPTGSRTTQAFKGGKVVSEVTKTNKEYESLGRTPSERAATIKAEAIKASEPKTITIDKSRTAQITRELREQGITNAEQLIEAVKQSNRPTNKESVSKKNAGNNRTTLIVDDKGKAIGVRDAETKTSRRLTSLEQGIVNLPVIESKLPQAERPYIIEDNRQYNVEGIIRTNKKPSIQGPQQETVIVTPTKKETSIISSAAKTFETIGRVGSEIAKSVGKGGAKFISSFSEEDQQTRIGIMGEEKPSITFTDIFFQKKSPPKELEEYQLKVERNLQLKDKSVKGVLSDPDVQSFGLTILGAGLGSGGGIGKEAAGKVPRVITALIKTEEITSGLIGGVKFVKTPTKEQAIESSLLALPIISRGASKVVSKVKSAITTRELKGKVATKSLITGEDIITDKRLTTTTKALSPEISVKPVEEISFVGRERTTRTGGIGKYAIKAELGPSRIISNKELPDIDYINVRGRGIERVSYDNNPYFEINNERSLIINKGNNIIKSPSRAIGEYTGRNINIIKDFDINIRADEINKLFTDIDYQYSEKGLIGSQLFGGGIGKKTVVLSTGGTPMTRQVIGVGKTTGFKAPRETVYNDIFTGKKASNYYDKITYEPKFISGKDKARIAGMTTEKLFFEGGKEQTYIRQYDTLSELFSTTRKVEGTNIKTPTYDITGKVMGGYPRAGRGQLFIIEKVVYPTKDTKTFTTIVNNKPKINEFIKKTTIINKESQGQVISGGLVQELILEEPKKQTIITSLMTEQKTKQEQKTNKQQSQYNKQEPQYKQEFFAKETTNKKSSLVNDNTIKSGFKNKQKTKSLIGTIISSINKQSSNTKEASKSLIDTKTISQTALITSMQSVNRQSQIIGSTQSQIVSSKTQTINKTLTQKINKTKNDFIEPEKNIKKSINNNKIITTEEDFIPKKKNNKGQAFLAYIKRKGEKIILGRGLSRESALNLGAYKTKTTLGATFGISPTGGPITREFGINTFRTKQKEFRPYKIVKGKKIMLENEFIQRRAYRLGTTSERKAIQQARKATNKPLDRRKQRWL